MVSQIQSSSQEIQQPSSNEIEQDNKAKANLVQQIMNAMNKAGELAFGEISFTDRMSRMQDIRTRLENKSIEDLQTLLATYQEPKIETAVVEETQEKVETPVVEVPKTETVQEVAPTVNEVSQETQIRANLVSQIISAMNQSGELAFGEISFTDRMSRMQDIRTRLENKSIEDLQTLLATYQEQSYTDEVQHSSSMRR